MTRVAFSLRLRPELVDEYVRLHSPVRAEMLGEIAASGRRDYTLFLGPDATLFGTYVVDDPVSSAAYLSASDVAAAWEAEMARYFLDLEGRPDQTATPLVEVFNLSDQLAAVDLTESTPE